MRCQSCDCNLNDIESTIQTEITRDYPDLCFRCLGTILEDILMIDPDTKGDVTIDKQYCPFQIKDYV